MSRAHWLRHPPRIVVLATIGFLALVVAWSVLTPLAEAPDEPAHLGLILDVAQHDGAYPQYDALPQKEGAFALCQAYAVSVKWCPTKTELAHHTVVRARPADEAPPKSSRPQWDAGTFTKAVPGRMNQMPQHPPLYYEVMAGALRLERGLTPGHWSVDHELAYLRLINALLLLPLPFLAWAAARRAGADDLVGSVAAVSMLGIPQLTHIGGALNNDNLFATVVGVLAVLLAGVARGDRSRRTAVLVGVAAAAALLTKGFAVVLPPVIVLAYLVGERARITDVAGRLRAWVDAARAAMGPLVVAGLVTIIGAGWWYVGKVATTGQVMPSIENHRLTAKLKAIGFHPSFGHYLSSLVSKVVEGFWGAYGWRSVKLPVPMSWAATIVSFAFLVIAWRRARPALETGETGAARSSTASVSKGMIAACVTPIAAFAAFVVIRSWVIYTGTSRLAFQQGRYLFAGLVGVAVVTASGAVQVVGRRRILPITAAAVVVIQAVGILAAYHGWWALGLRTGFVQPVRATVAWSGWPDPLALVLLLLPAIPVALLLRQVWLDRSRWADDAVAAEVPTTSGPVPEPASVG